MASNVGSRAFQNERLRKQFRKEVPVLMQAAVNAYRAGKRAEAAALCRRIIEILPDTFDAQHLLGVVELEGGNFTEAERALTRAVDANPRSAEAYSNLGMALFNLERFEEARRLQEKALALQPNFATARTNLGNTLMRLDHLEQAVQAHDEAIRLKPDYSDAHLNRGMALLVLNRNEEADQSFDCALALRPRQLQAIIGKGVVSHNLRHYDAALTHFGAALAINPASAEALAHRGRVYTRMKEFEKAEADFAAALAVDPKLEAAWRGKSHVMVLKHDVAEAMVCCTKVLASNPNCAITTFLLGDCYAQRGDLQAAIAHMDRALAIKPDFEEAISLKIFMVDFDNVDFAVHQAVRKSWWEAVGAKIPSRQLGPRNLHSERRLIVGYVSSDFRNHSAALTFKPLLRHHDRANFEVVCYSCSAKRDAVTEECRSMADRWVDARQLSDRELAERIEADGIDILVDLSGHSDGNRLSVFAAKPAPVQVTAWGHATGTGLSTIDYLFSDPILVPRQARHLFAERVHDLPCAITIEPLPEAQSSPLPMTRNGYVTFGVFNRIDKISDRVLAAWSRLLQAMEGSVITVKHNALSKEFMRDNLIARFGALGIAQDRVRCLGATSRKQHLAEFANIDISLDPFPQNGGVSTWESLQMGVPVVAKLGASCASRIGASIVSAIGLDDWVAEDDERYVAIAKEFATRPEELAALRAKLPAMVASSDAGNNEIYTRRVEEAYRRFWRNYCSSTDTPA